MKDSTGYCSVHQSYHCECPQEKLHTILTCPVHGEYEVTSNQKPCPTCLTQAALYRQIEMDGVEGIKPAHEETDGQVYLRHERDWILHRKEDLEQSKATMEAEGFRFEKEHALGDCLDEAKRTICGERQDVYGSPEDSFTLIANYWNAYLATKDGMLSALDIAHMMILFKMARVQGQAPSRDSYVDICGYAGIAADRLSK